MTLSDSLFVLSHGLNNLSEYEKASYRVAKKALSDRIWETEGFSFEEFLADIAFVSYAWGSYGQSCHHLYKG